MMVDRGRDRGERLLLGRGGEGLNVWCCRAVTHSTEHRDQGVLCTSPLVDNARPSGPTAFPVLGVRRAAGRAIDELKTD